MSGPTCPSCGVAVLPGYTRCPKCRAKLQGGAVISQKVAGGTTIQDRSLPILPVAGVVVVIGGLIAFFALRDGGSSSAPAATSQPVPQPAVITGGQAATPPTPDPIATITPTGPSAETVATELVKTLNRQRLWSEGNVIGTRLDVSSGACEEAGMAPAFDSARAQLKAAGLTQVRCLDKSGRPVFVRDL